jgi:hypothetical protein
MTTSKKPLLENSPLINFALRGLSSCWLSNEIRWSHIYHLDGRANPNESLPHSDVFYSINVLLGLSRVRQTPPDVDLFGVFQVNVPKLMTLPVAKYAFGCALWAAAELEFEIPDAVLRHFELMISERADWLSFRAQELGMILTGVVAQAKVNRNKWASLAERLFAFLLERYHCPSGLFCDAPSGLRRRYGSFASQTYLAIACYAYGEFANDDRAIELANSCVYRLIALQGQNGEWPWFFDALKGVVLDYYEVYSVHQYGMAPAFLERAEHHGVTGARDALIKGFNWFLGENQLGIPMVVPRLQLTIRSQARRGELHTKVWRAMRVGRASLLGTKARLCDPRRIELRRECRSYELGWILWSFGQRSDVPQLTNHVLFTDQDIIQRPSGLP